MNRLRIWVEVRAWLLACVVVVVGWSCTAPDEAFFTAERSDSAGVAMVDFSELPAPSTSRLRLSSEPVLVLGQGDGTSEAEFFDVAGVVRLGDGRIVVADGGSSTLRYFDSKGAFAGTVGGVGEGPGEFKSLSFVARLGGDSILATDASLGRLQVFGPEGLYVDGMSLRGNAETSWSPTPLGVLSTGQVLAIQRSLPTQPGSGEPERDPVTLLLIDRINGSRDTVAILNGPGQLIRATERGFSMEAITFGGNSDASAAGRIVAAVDTDVLGVRVFEDGALSTVVRVHRPPVPVTQETLADYAEEALALWPPGAPREAQEGFRQRVLTGPHGTNLPQVTAVEVDAVGRIWLNLGRTPGHLQETFEVFDRRGDWLGEVTFPAGLDRGTNGSNGPGIDIGADYVLGVWRDEFGVESVRLYALQDIPVQSP
ncbi:MAG: hypothetical protein MUO50_18540 [Longimicrobiales bacterium]|nr:hypothetical protein [Longimicrobiales bacterium]